MTLKKLSHLCFNILHGSRVASSMRKQNIKILYVCLFFHMDYLPLLSARRLNITAALLSLSVAKAVVKPSLQIIYS